MTIDKAIDAKDVAHSVLNDCVGMSIQHDTQTITMTPHSFYLCIQAVLARYALQPDTICITRKDLAYFSERDLKALAEFKAKYPTWWWKIGYCGLTRDFDAAPQSHSPEITYIESGQWPDDAFSCDHEGSIADAIYDVMAQIDKLLER